MSDLSAKFAALTSDINANEAARNSDDDALRTIVQNMANLLDVMNENAAANTKAILSALGQTGACFPCPTPSIVVPSPGTTAGTVNVDRCKRSEAFIATMHKIFAAFDTLQSFNVIGTFSVLNDAISQVIATIAAGDTIPLPSFPETVNIVGDYISYAGERAFSGVSLISQFTPLEASLHNALYNTSTQGAAQSAYNSIIDGSSASNGAKLLFKATAYTALFNYYFDPSTSPDLSSFSGSSCSVVAGTCFTLIPAQAHFSNGNTPFVVHTAFGPFSPVTSVTTSSGVVTSDIPAFFAGNTNGWFAYADGSGMSFAHRTGDLSSSGIFDSGGIPVGSGSAIALPTTGSFFIQGSGATVHICFGHV